MRGVFVMFHHSVRNRTLTAWVAFPLIQYKKNAAVFSS
jgi:hypothetical protein